MLTPTITFNFLRPRVVATFTAQAVFDVAPREGAVQHARRRLRQLRPHVAQPSEVSLRASHWAEGVASCGAGLPASGRSIAGIREAGARQRHLVRRRRAARYADAATQGQRREVSGMRSLADLPSHESVNVRAVVADHTLVHLNAAQLHVIGNGARHAGVVTAGVVWFIDHACRQSPEGMLGETAHGQSAVGWVELGGCGSGIAVVHVVVEDVLVHGRWLATVPATRRRRHHRHRGSATTTGPAGGKADCFVLLR